MIRITAISVILLCASLGTALRAQTEEENPLAGTPFADRWGDLKNDVLSGKTTFDVTEPTGREGKNEDKFVAAVDQLQLCYIQLIENYGLREALELSDSQYESLRRVPSPTPVSVMESVVGDRNAFAMDEKRFDVLLRRWSKVAKKEMDESDRRVEEILDKRQLQRLKELGFQHYTVLYTVPRAAFHYHDRKLTREEVAIVLREFSKFRRQVSVAKGIFEFRERSKLLAEAIGEKSLREFIGEPHHFSREIKQFPALSELLNIDKPQLSRNRRREAK